MAYYGSYANEQRLRQIRADESAQVKSEQAKSAEKDAVETADAETSDTGADDKTVPERRLPDAPEETPDNTNVDVEMTPGGSSISASTVAEKPDMDIPKKRPASKPYAKAKAKRQAKTVYVRELPAEMANVAINEFNGVANRTDSVAAYIAVMSGERAGLTESQLALVESHDSEDPMANINERMRRMEKDMQEMKSTLQELRLMCGYLMFDRLGFRRDDPNTPGDTDMLEPGMEAMLKRTKEQSKTRIERERRHNGPPIR